MSKKNKKHSIDYFNMTPEEQMANAEMFHDVEQGEANFLDALKCKVPTGPIAQSDYTKQIERACLSSFKKCEDEEEINYLEGIDNAINESNISVDNESDSTDSQYTPYSSLTIKESITHTEEITEEYNNEDDTDDIIIDDDIDEDNEEEENKSDIPENTNDDCIPRVHFHYEPIVGKMLIDDGLVQTPVSVYHTSSIELDKEIVPTDNDALGEMMSKIFYYIITCKHPSVIMSENIFEIEFSLYSKINKDRFLFFKNDGFVYVYVLDENEADNFYSVIDVFNMDDEDTLRYVVGAAYASNTMHNIFMYNDDDEVESVREARHSVKELLKLIDADPETDYAGHNAIGSVLNRLNVVDLQTFINDVRDILDDLIVDDDDYDEDDEDTESDDEDIDVSDYPDIDDIDDDIDISDDNYKDESSIVETTVVTETTPIEQVDIDHNSDDSDMVVPVIHRH